MTDATNAEMGTFATRSSTAVRMRKLRWLALLAVLPLGCSSRKSTAEKSRGSDTVIPVIAVREKPQPLPKDIVKAWEAAQCGYGRIEINHDGHIHFDSEELHKLRNGQPSELTIDQVPAFGFGPPGPYDRFLTRLAKLPVPPTAFGLHLSRNGPEGYLKELPDLKTLRALDFDGAEPRDADLKDLARFESLETLRLNCPFITDAGIEHLTALKNLRALNLVQAKLTDAGLKKLATLNNLEVLQLYCDGVSDEGLKELSRLTNLRTLFVFGEKITDAGILNLAPLNNLQYLIMARTKMTDAGIPNFAALSNLRYLALSNINITDAGIPDFAGLKNLHGLALFDTKVSKAGKEKLKNALPDCDCKVSP